MPAVEQSHFVPYSASGDPTGKGRNMTDARITLDSSRRGGRPCIRNLRISVYDVLAMLADGMSEAGIIEDFPELAPADIRACLAFAANREHNLYTVAI
jgi:uncharacterized protein (DUF433 family)